MSGAPLHPASPQDNQQELHWNANGDQNNGCVDSHIVELSQIIDGEIRSHTWKSRSDQAAETIFFVPKTNNEKLHHSAADDKMMSTYQPAFLSIGPYHANATEDMRRNEQCKLSAMDKCIPVDGGRPSLLEYTQAVQSMENKARRCYEGDVVMDSNTFCRMLLLDAFQLIQALKFLGDFTAEDATAAGGGGTTEAASPSSSSSQGCSIRIWDIVMIIHDLMMLENQIPFFVAEKIYELHNGNAGAAMTPLRRIAWEAIRNMVGGVPSSAPTDDDLRLFKFQHLVHVCHVYLKPTCLINTDASSTQNMNQKTTDKYGRFRRATEYYEAGVTFRRWCSEGGSSQHRPVLDVAFNDGVLSVALQDIHDNTGYILRNLLAYEQKYHWKATNPDTSYVTAYVIFMSQLLRSTEDVVLLSRRGVLEHLLGDDAEVCALFWRLADGLAFDPGREHYLSPVEAALQDHCRHRRHRWRAWIVRHRFSNPWLVAAWLFGGFAVLCTIIQTVFTVLSYMQQIH